MRAYINTVNGITVVCNGIPYHMSRDDKAYQELLEAVQSTDTDEEQILHILERTKRKVQDAVRLTPNMTYDGGIVRYRGMPMHGYAIDKLVALVKDGQDPKPLANFLDLLQNNPSSQTVEDLYAFLEHGRIPITERGTFLAYKAIRGDWKDIHSGKFDNSIGQILEMPRSQVDDRRENTCSRGFHVCSYDYLPHFSHANGHVVICEINPADVVSIPTDYNNTKMRVCRYQVIGEVEGYYRNRNILSESEIWEENYRVYYRYNDDEEWEEGETFDDKDDAVFEAQTLIAEDGADEVKVTNNGVIVYTQKGV